MPLIAENAIGPQTIEYVQVRMTAAMGDPASGVIAVVLGLLIVVLAGVADGARERRSRRAPLGLRRCPEGDLNPHALYGH